MPIYEYSCKKCNHTFEVWHEAGKNGSQKCPECSGKAAKVFHAPGLIFKGSGFHVTDYCSKNGAISSSKKPAKCEKKSESNCAACSE